MRILLGHNTGHNVFANLWHVRTDGQHFNRGINIHQRCSLEYAHRPIECISLGFKRFGRGLGLPETCSTIVRCKPYSYEYI